MPTAQLVNLNHGGWPDGDNCFYIGRSKKRESPLGNPFVLGKDGDRQAVLQKYRRWLWGEIKKGNASPVYRELQNLTSNYLASTEWQPMRLLCWCHPLPCHGSVIIAAMDWLIKTNQVNQC